MLTFQTMKKDIHPNVRKVLFKDITTDENFIIDSCVETEEKTTHEGVEYLSIIHI